MITNEKLEKLRTYMSQNSIDAVVIPSTDPHSSEYVHPHWKSRAWISGFTGSAGTVVVTATRAILWTDFRYYIQAAKEIKDSSFELFKMGLPDVPTVVNFLKDTLESGDVVGFDGTLISTEIYNLYKLELDQKGISINRAFDPISDIWLDRPKGASSIAYSLDIKYAGESREDKIIRVRDLMDKKNVDSYILSSLADIAWLYNIRGEDIDFTPLIISFALITKSDALLFIEDYKLPKVLKSELESSGLTIMDYKEIGNNIAKIPRGSTVYYMADTLNCYLSGLIPTDCNVKTGLDFTATLKTIKNATEISNIRLAMEKDGASLVKFFKSLEEGMATGKRYTEYSLSQIIREFRLDMDGCVDESFGPIVGYSGNGALCHYSAEEDGSLTINSNGLLLIDSGGQYFEGTTDITRTTAMGIPTKEEILHYTLVLKGHVKLALAKFPEGTTGCQLDILARQPLWEHGLNFGHGTGHGVGFFLGVHEGPQSISPRGYKEAFKEGMVTSNEPGLYIEDKHGIRIENIILTVPLEDGLEEKFYGFETLTLYPYDTKLIDRSLLTDREIDWINNYHNTVIKRVSPLLTEDEAKWLKEKACEI